MSIGGSGDWPGHSSGRSDGPRSAATPPRHHPVRPAAPAPQFQQPPPAWFAPPPSSAPMPPPPRRAPWLPWLVVAALVVVVALVIGLLRPGTPTAEPTPPPSTRDASPTPSPTPSPTDTGQPTSSVATPTASVTPTPVTQPTVDAGPRAWELPPATWPPLATPPAKDQAWAALQAPTLSALAPVELTGCPVPLRVADERAWRSAVREQWHCVHAAWVPVFTTLGWPTTEPEIHFFPGKGSKSECGYLEAPAFYCSAEGGAVYFGREHLDMASAWDLSVNEMVNHEYGHHLQNLAGITVAKASVPQTDDIERRSELQATCWAATMTWHNRSFDFDEGDLASWQSRLDSMLVDGVHGSRESIQYWGMRGLYATTMGDCNTWLVESDKVT